MSRQQRTSVRGSVKTSAGKYAFPLLFDIVADVFFFFFKKSNRKPADFAQTRCANGVFSARDDWSLGVRGHRCWISFERQRFVAADKKKNKKNSQTV